MSRLALLFVLLCNGTIAYTQQANQKVVLFDGKSVDNLRGYKMDSFPWQAWKLENGAIMAMPDVPNIDIVSRDTFTNFDMTFEWKMSKAGNSGVFHHVQENSPHQSGDGNSPNWLDNFEYQLLDDIDFEDKEPKRSAAAVYDLIAPQNKQLKKVGEFNKSRLVVRNGHVEHWVNGKKVLEYDSDSPEMKTLIANSKFKDNPNFAKSTTGHIMFQHHGQQMWLRNIVVTRL